MIYKILHRKQWSIKYYTENKTSSNTNQTNNRGVNSYASVPAPDVTPIVLLLLQVMKKEMTEGTPIIYKTLPRKLTSDHH